MASFAKRHNQANANFTYEMPEGHEFIDLRSLADEFGVDTVHTVRMIYLNNKGHYGTQPAIVTDDYIVNAPAHLTNCAKEILSDAESVNLINKGHVGFKLYEYENRFGTQYSIEWVDIDEPKEDKKKKN